jgi:uncharacterized protein (DUF952 family)
MQPFRESDGSTNPEDSGRIYKVCSRGDWEALCRLGTWDGSPDDLRDGFIHFSTAEQLAATIRKHFAGQSDLYLLTVDARFSGDQLRWEPSRGGALFPHLYGSLSLSAVMQAVPLLLDANGDVIPAPLE